MAETKDDNQNNVSVVRSCILKEINKALTQAPCHGTITISLIFRDSKLSRWLLAKEESRQVG